LPTIERISSVSVSVEVSRAELRRYLGRVSDRWPVEAAYLGGARVDDERGAPLQRERGPEFIVVLVSSAFDNIPWLERVYTAGSLWDGLEMGSAAEVHCYTPPEFQRKQAQLPKVRDVVWHGLDLLATA
jgi:uncharacterized protein